MDQLRHGRGLIVLVKRRVGRREPHLDWDQRGGGRGVVLQLQLSLLGDLDGDRHGGGRRRGVVLQVRLLREQLGYRRRVEDVLRVVVHRVRRGVADPADARIAREAAEDSPVRTLRPNGGQSAICDFVVSPPPKRRPEPEHLPGSGAPQLQSHPSPLDCAGSSFGARQSPRALPALPPALPEYSQGPRHDAGGATASASHGAAMSVELDDVKFVVAFQASARMHGDCARGSLASSPARADPPRPRRSWGLRRGRRTGCST